MAEEKKVRTVNDFKKHVIKLSDSKDYLEFIEESDLRGAFWTKLNRIGARNIETQPPETVPNIDATVILSDQEWEELDSELQQLL